MPFISVPDSAEAIIQFSSSAGLAYNTPTFWKPDGYDETSLQELADAIDAAVDELYLPMLHEDWSYIGTHVRGLNEVIDLEAIAVAGIGPGTVTGNPLGASATKCVSLRTGFTGRSARGRFYTVGMASGQIDNPGVVNSGYITAAVALVVGLQTAAAAEGWQLVVVSRKTNGVVNNPAITRPVTAIAAVNANLDHQDRRLKGRGI